MSNEVLLPTARILQSLSRTMEAVFVGNWAQSSKGPFRSFGCPMLPDDSLGILLLVKFTDPTPEPVTLILSFCRSLRHKLKNLVPWYLGATGICEMKWKLAWAGVLW